MINVYYAILHIIIYIIVYIYTWYTKQDSQHFISSLNMNSFFIYQIKLDFRIYFQMIYKLSWFTTTFFKLCEVKSERPYPKGSHC